jgi:hypothetical protein
MGMQDVDFELIYQPGKDEADPLDFLSRHPLPETGRDKVFKQVVNADHAVVINQIQKETQRDSQLQKLSNESGREIEKTTEEIPTSCLSTA